MKETDYITVTGVLNRYTDFSMIPEETLNFASERGTFIHGACCAQALGVPWMKPIPEDFQGYIDSFKRWKDLHVVKVALAERRLYDHVYKYSGKIDLIVEMKTEGLVLVDLKTPVAFKKIWLWQIAAYENLARTTFPVRKGGTLQLSPDGAPAKMVWRGESPRDFGFFISALQIKRELGF